MGSFNTTCFVSQQTIVPGAKCIILPIIQQSTYDEIQLISPDKSFETSVLGHAHTTCYPTCFWGYYAPLITGTYYDYGKFEIDNSGENIQSLKFLFNKLLKDSFKTKQGENEYHDHAFDMSSLYSSDTEYSFEQLIGIWDEIWMVTSEHRLFVRNYKHQPRSFQFAVMHQKSAEYLINMVSNEKSWDGMSYHQFNYFQNYIKSKLVKFVDETKDIPPELLEFVFWRIESLDGYRVGDSEGSFISSLYCSPNGVIDILQTMVTGDLSKMNELFDLYKTQLDHRYIHHGLDDLNIKLSPMVYASQDYSNDLGSAFLEMVKTVNADINAEIKARYGEDDDEDVE